MAMSGAHERGGGVAPRAGGRQITATCRREDTSKEKLREKLRLTDDQGRVGHAELELGPTTLMLADEHPELGILSPLACGGTGLRLHLHLDDVDALGRRAAAGATILLEPTDFPHGERQCRLRDPFGHEWLLGHEIGEAPAESARP